mgnify:CR=1 FL=1
MREYHGILVNVSQEDKSIFDELKILGQKKAWGWILYRIEVPSNKINQIIKRLQLNMVNGLYFHFYKDDDLIVIFNKKIFKAKTDKSTWKKIIDYGKSLNIPEKQLDFYPCKI